MFVPLRTLLRIPLSTSLCSWFDIAWGFIPRVSASAVTDSPGRFTNACRRRRRVALARTLNIRSSPPACIAESNGRAASLGFGRHVLLVVMSLTWINAHYMYYYTILCNASRGEDHD